MVYFKTKKGNIFYKTLNRIVITVNTVDNEVLNEAPRFNELFHVGVTKEEFINAFEQVIKRLNEKVYV